jgi:hypothetical protein
MKQVNLKRVKWMLIAQSKEKIRLLFITYASFNFWRLFFKSVLSYQFCGVIPLPLPDIGTEMRSVEILESTHKTQSQRTSEKN